MHAQVTQEVHTQTNGPLHIAGVMLAIMDWVAGSTHGKSILKGLN
jgi:hypothetical protein